MAELEPLKALIALVTPILVASYVGEKAWEHKRHWFQVPKGWKLPKIEVACFTSSVASLILIALVLG
jgi:hypothetical protein